MRLLWAPSGAAGHRLHGPISCRVEFRLWEGVAMGGCRRWGCNLGGGGWPNRADKRCIILEGGGGVRPHFASVKEFFSVLGHKSIHGVKVKILCYAYLVTCRHHLVLPKARCSPGVLDVTCFCSVSVLKVCVRHDSGDRHKLLKQVFFRCFKGVLKECLRGSSGVLSHNS